MKSPIALLGLGQLGSLFAHAFLRLGHPVIPLLRDDTEGLANLALAPPEALMVACGDMDLPGVLETLPDPLRNRTILLQNELLPYHYTPYLTSPTVISIWFEKKGTSPPKSLLPSPVLGPFAPLLEQALDIFKLPCHPLSTQEELLLALVGKNLYILTVNSCGLKVGGTTGTLLERHHLLADRVVEEVLSLQEALLGCTLDRPPLRAHFREAALADPNHKLLGRSAPQRLRRALAQAAEHNLSLPLLTSLKAYLP